MASQQRLLKTLLQPLIQEWGHEQVSLALKQLATENESQDRERPKADKPSKTKATKPRAIDLVTRANFPQSQASILEDVARRYDSRHFLPSPSDVREFLLLLGERHSPIKDRSDAFRIVLRKLSTLSLERLDQLANSSLHSGPSRLGPLSDAISAAATSLPRHREHSSLLTGDVKTENSVANSSDPEGTSAKTDVPGTASGKIGEPQ